MTHDEIMVRRGAAKIYRESGQTAIAATIERLVDECLRLRQGLWDAAKACGADTDGNETPAPLVSDIVEFTLSAARDLRRDYDECLNAGQPETEGGVAVGQVYAEKDKRMKGRHVVVREIKGRYAYCSPSTSFGRVLVERRTRIALANLPKRFNLVGTAEP